MSSDGMTSGASRAVRARAFLALLRPLNAAIAFAGVPAGALIAGAGTDLWPRMLAGGAASFLLTASSNVLNDVLDVEADRVNRPRRAIAAGLVSQRAGVWCSAITALAGLALSALLGLPPLLFAAVALLLSLAYNLRLQRVPLAGNAAVGLLSGSIFVFGALLAERPLGGALPALFAMLYSIARELLKDMEDEEGDRRAGIRTLPIAAGQVFTARLVIAMLLLLLAACPLPYFFRIYSIAYLVCVASTVQPVLIFAIVRLLQSRERRTVSMLSMLLKYAMLAGMAAFLAGARLS
jgi:geranylgeranylglycerol-phosphate geranylgeranyltransferase